MGFPQVWQEYELAPLRALVEDEDMGSMEPGGEGPCVVEGMYAPPKLLWRSIVASMQGLRFGGGPPVGQDQFAQLPLPHLQPPGLCLHMLCVLFSSKALRMHLIVHETPLVGRS